MNLTYLVEVGFYALVDRVYVARIEGWVRVRVCEVFGLVQLGLNEKQSDELKILQRSTSWSAELCLTFVQVSSPAKKTLKFCSFRWRSHESSLIWLASKLLLTSPKVGRPPVVSACKR